MKGITMKSVLLVIFAMTVSSTAFAEKERPKDEHHHKRQCEMVTAPVAPTHGIMTTKVEMSCEECCHKLMLIRHGANVSITCEAKHRRNSDDANFCSKIDDDKEKWED
jgi:hypothetical protein